MIFNADDKKYIGDIIDQEYIDRLGLTIDDSRLRMELHTAKLMDISVREVRRRLKDYDERKSNCPMG